LPLPFYFHTFYFLSQKDPQSLFFSLNNHIFQNSHPHNKTRQIEKKKAKESSHKKFGVEVMWKVWNLSQETDKIITVHSGCIILFSNIEYQSRKRYD